MRFSRWTHHKESRTVLRVVGDRTGEPEKDDYKCKRACWRFARVNEAAWDRNYHDCVEAQDWDAPVAPESGGCNERIEYRRCGSCRSGPGARGHGCDWVWIARSS